jgi:hypothetical protein
MGGREARTVRDQTADCAELAPGINCGNAIGMKVQADLSRSRAVILSPGYDAIEGRRIYCGGGPEFRDYVQLSPPGGAAAGGRMSWFA